MLAQLATLQDQGVAQELIKGNYGPFTWEHKPRLSIKEEDLEFSEGVDVESSKGKDVQPSKDEGVQPSEGEGVQPSEGEDV